MIQHHQGTIPETSSRNKNARGFPKTFVRMAEGSHQTDTKGKSL